MDLDLRPVDLVLTISESEHLEKDLDLPLWDLTTSLSLSLGGVDSTVDDSA